MVDLLVDALDGGVALVHLEVELLGSLQGLDGRGQLALLLVALSQQVGTVRHSGQGQHGVGLFEVVDGRFQLAGFQLQLSL